MHPSLRLSALLRQLEHTRDSSPKCQWSKSRKSKQRAQSFARTVYVTRESSRSTDGPIRLKNLSYLRIRANNLFRKSAKAHSLNGLVALDHKTCQGKSAY